MIEIFAQNHEVDFIENDTLDCGLAFSFLGYRRMAKLIVQFQAQNTNFHLVIVLLLHQPVTKKNSTIFFVVVFIFIVVAVQKSSHNINKNQNKKKLF